MAAGPKLELRLHEPESEKAKGTPSPGPWVVAQHGCDLQVPAAPQSPQDPWRLVDRPHRGGIQGRGSASCGPEAGGGEAQRGKCVRGWAKGWPKWEEASSRRTASTGDPPGTLGLPPESPGVSPSFRAGPCVVKTGFRYPYAHWWPHASPQASCGPGPGRTVTQSSCPVCPFPHGIELQPGTGRGWCR